MTTNKLIISLSIIITLASSGISYPANAKARFSCCKKAGAAVNHAGDVIKSGVKNGQEAASNAGEQIVIVAQNSVESAQQAGKDVADAAKKIDPTAGAGPKRWGEVLDSYGEKIKKEAERRKAQLKAAQDQLLAYKDSLADAVTQVGVNIGGVVQNVFVQIGESVNDAVRRVEKGLTNLSHAAWERYKGVEHSLLTTRDNITRATQRRASIESALAALPKVNGPAYIQERVDAIRLPNAVKNFDLPNINPDLQNLKQSWNSGLPAAWKDISGSLGSAQANFSSWSLPELGKKLDRGWVNLRDNVSQGAQNAWSAVRGAGARFDAWRLDVTNFSFKCGDDPGSINGISKTRYYFKAAECIQNDNKERLAAITRYEQELDRLWVETTGALSAQIRQLHTDLDELEFSAPVEGDEDANSVDADDASFAGVADLALIGRGGLALQDETHIDLPGAVITPGESTSPGHEDGNCVGAGCGNNSSTSPGVGNSGSSNGSGGGHNGSDDAGDVDDNGVGDQGDDDEGELESPSKPRDKSWHDDQNSPGAGNGNSNDSSLPPGAEAARAKDAYHKAKDRAAELDAKIADLDARVQRSRNSPALETFKSIQLSTAWSDDLSRLNDFGEERVSRMRDALNTSSERMQSTEKSADIWLDYIGSSAKAGLGAETIEQATARLHLEQLTYPNLSQSDSGTSRFYTDMTQQNFISPFVSFDAAAANRDRFLAVNGLWSDAMRQFAKDRRADDSAARRVDFAKAVYDFGAAVGGSEDESGPLTGDERQLAAVAQYSDAARNYIDTHPELDDREQRLAMVNTADQAIAQSKKYLQNGDHERAEIAKSIAVGLLDASLSFVPGVGWAKDAYEAITGRNLLTNEPLSDFERTFAVIGVFTAGIGSKVKTATKALDVAHDIAVAGGHLGVGAIGAASKAASVAKEAEAKWQSVKALLHSTKGNIKKAKDGTWKLVDGMHTQKGLDHLLNLNKKAGREFPIRTINNSAEFSKEFKNSTEILEETLPNGVKRVQLPGELWHTVGDAASSPKDLVAGGRVRGIKTLWPEAIGVDKQAEAIADVLKQNPSPTKRSLCGIYGNIRVVVYLDAQGAVTNAHPSWHQFTPCD